MLINFGANPFLLNNYTEHKGVAAVLDAYYPQRFAGPAVADVLSGAYPPAGRLPFSWVRGLSDSGDLGNYTMAGTSKTYRYELPNKTAPLFPFGYGLSYTSFKYSALAVSPATVQPCKGAEVSVQVANTGAVDSDEVVQVYASWEGSKLASPARQLVGFDRVHVRAGQSTTVKITVAPEQMALIDDSDTTALPVWTVAPATVHLSVGGQQPNQATTAPSNLLSASFAIAGTPTPLSHCG